MLPAGRLEWNETSERTREKIADAEKISKIKKRRGEKSVIKRYSHVAATTHRVSRRTAAVVAFVCITIFTRCSMPSQAAAGGAGESDFEHGIVVLVNDFIVVKCSPELQSPIAPFFSSCARVLRHSAFVAFVHPFSFLSSFLIFQPVSSSRCRIFVTWLSRCRAVAVVAIKINMPLNYSIGNPLANKASRGRKMKI